jgi:hypothetical protein
MAALAIDLKQRPRTTERTALAAGLRKGLKFMMFFGGRPDSRQPKDEQRPGTGKLCQCTDAMDG